MGWLFSERSREALIQHILGMYHPGGESKTPIIGHALTSFRSHLWTVHENTASENRTRFIVLWLLASHDGMHGYKDIDEDMGPCEKDCPLRLLNLAEPSACRTDGYGMKWREEVREWHKAEAARKKRAKRSFDAGAIVTVPGGTTCTVVSPYDRAHGYRGARGSWYVLRRADGSLYRERAANLEIAPADVNQPVAEKEHAVA